MTTVNQVSQTDTSLYTYGVAGTNAAQKAQATANTELPAGQSLSDILDSLDLPELPLSMRGISVDTLLNAVADEERRNGIQAAVDSIETHGEAMNAENEKKLEEIKEQLEQMKKQSIWQAFAKVFQVIGAILGAIASVATIAIGAATGNPLLVAAGVVGIAMSVDSALSMATDGKVSLSAGITAACKACGMSEDTAKWVAFGINMGLMVASVAVSFGAAAGSSAAAASGKIAEAGAKAAQTISTVSKVATVGNVAQGVTGVGQGICSAGLTYTQYQISKLEANKVDIDAILENLRNLMEMEQDLVEEQMKAADQLMSDVKDIVEDCSQTATAILTSAPTAA